MNRQLKWVGFAVIVVIAAIFGMALSSFVSANASVGGSVLFTLAMFAMVGGIVWWLLSGNKQVAMADASAISAALSMQPAEGKAAIYIMRKGFVGMLQGFNFEIDGIARGQAKGNQFLHAELAPGTYCIMARAKGNQGETQVTIAPGTVVVLRVFLEPGLMKGMIMFDRVANSVSTRADLASIKMVCWES